MAGVRGDYEGRELATRAYRRLNPGPGRSPEAVAANQCARLRAAMIELCAELGYPRVTVRALARRAGVSTRTFYAHFSDKEDCFLSTYDYIASTSVRGLLAPRVGEAEETGDWRRPLVSGFRIFSDQLAQNPLAARLALVEAFAAGPDALARMRHTDGLFEALVAKSFARPPEGVELPVLLVKGIVAGIAWVARGRLLAGRERRFALDGRELMEWAVSLRNEAVRGIDRLPVPPGEPARLPDRSPPLDDRSLILAATARLVTAGGYEALSVPAILSRAGLPRRSFDNCFDDVADCFLACLDQRGEAVLAAARSAFESAESWPAAVHRAVDAICARIAVDPTLAMLAFRELYSPGQKGVRWRVEATSRLSAALRDSAPASQAPSGLAAEASLGGIWGVIHGHVVAGATPRLRAAAPALSLLVLAPAIGPEAASAAILAEVGGRGRKGTGAG